MVDSAIDSWPALDVGIRSLDWHKRGQQISDIIANRTKTQWLEALALLAGDLWKCAASVGATADSCNLLCDNFWRRGADRSGAEGIGKPSENRISGRRRQRQRTYAVRKLSSPVITFPRAIAILSGTRVDRMCGLDVRRFFEEWRIWIRPLLIVTYVIFAIIVVPLLIVNSVKDGFQRNLLWVFLNQWKLYQTEL